MEIYIGRGSRIFLEGLDFALGRVTEILLLAQQDLGRFDKSTLRFSPDFPPLPLPIFAPIARPHPAAEMLGRADKAVTAASAFVEKEIILIGICHESIINECGFYGLRINYKNHFEFSILDSIIEREAQISNAFAY
jgi:hypothetical protein